MTYYRASGSKDQNLLTQAFDAFKKAYAADTKKKFEQDILVNLDTMRQNYYNKGLAYFNAQDYNNSMSSFEEGAKLYDVLGQVDTALLLTAAVAAEKAERYDKARDYYEQVLKSGNKAAETYYGLTVFYTKLQDQKNAMRIINEGRALYPKNLDLIKAETNMYLAFVYYAMGSLYDKITNDTSKTREVRDKAFTDALVAYQKAIDLNPQYFNAYYSAGILYNNLAAELLNKANNLPSDAVQEYNKITAEAEANLDKALPFLEKATQLDPKDESTLIALKQIYVRKKQTDKAKEINERLNALKQK
jgi:tetratricopeptide (TPR) repeat protein